MSALPIAIPKEFLHEFCGRFYGQAKADMVVAEMGAHGYSCPEDYPGSLLPREVLLS
jgi:hypothetical protein